MLSKAFAPLVKWARYCDWSGRGAGMACAGDISTRDQVRGGGPQSFAREGARAPRRSLGTSPRAKMTDHRESDGGQIGLVGCGGAIFFWDEHGKFHEI